MVPSNIEIFTIFYLKHIRLCDINDCDFIKTRIKEYQNKKEFKKKEGIILNFISKHDVDNKPFYVHMPFNILSLHFYSWID